MTDFLNGYYGAAGPLLLQYIDLIGAAVSRQPALWLGVYDATTRHWLTLEDLTAATRLFSQAEAAVAGDETLLRRVRRAKLSIDVVWVERYRELARTARDEGLPFLGPEDPYAEVARIGANEFQSGSYREWADFSEYVGKLRALFPPRSGPKPPQCEGLRPGEWEEIQEQRLEVLPAGGSSQIVDDPTASDGKALRLEGTDKALEGRFKLPQSLAGRWRVYVVLRAEPDGPDPAAVVAGIYAWNMPGGNANEVSRVTVECPPERSGEYQTIDLGVHRLMEGATVQVQPNGSGTYGRVKATWVDRLILVQAD